MDRTIEIVEKITKTNWPYVFAELPKSQEGRAEEVSIISYQEDKAEHHDVYAIQYISKRYSETKNDFVKRRYAIFLMNSDIDSERIAELCQETLALFEMGDDLPCYADYVDLKNVLMVVKNRKDEQLTAKYIDIVKNIIESYRSSEDAGYINITGLAIKNMNLIGQDWFWNFLKGRDVFRTYFGLPTGKDEEFRKLYEYFKIDFLYSVFYSLILYSYQELVKKSF